MQDIGSVPGVGRYLIRLDTMRDCCPCSARPLHTFALVFVQSRRSVQLSCTLRRSRPCLCPATRATQTVAAVVPATSPSRFPSPGLSHIDARPSILTTSAPIWEDSRGYRGLGGTHGGLETVRTIEHVEHVALVMVFFCHKLGKSFLTRRTSPLCISILRWLDYHSNSKTLDWQPRTSLRVSFLWP